jgi:hypothetical protein
MKRIINIAIFAICCLGMVPAVAQNCALLIPDREGAKLESTFYEKKDKVKSVSTVTIKKITTTATGKEFLLESVVTEKGKDPVTAEFSMVCQGDKFIIDMKRFLGPDQAGTLKDAKVTATNLEYPAVMAVGQSLADGHIDVSITQGMPFPINTVIDIVNRKVVAQESVTTPAGTFDCIKIEYDMNMKMMGMTVNSKAAEWICLGVGTIKSESFDAKGKSQGYNLLTKLEK